MSFNLPPNRLLRLTKGDWRQVQYPATAIVQVQLLPRDFFEPVDQDHSRSCIPAGGKNFSWLFDANTGSMRLRGETMLPPASVSFRVNDDALNVNFVGRCMQVTQTIESEDQLHSLLTGCEHTLPALLSTTTALAIFCESLVMRLGDVVEARSETFLPPNSVRVVDAEARIEDLKKAIQLVGISLNSPRFTLATTYYREALYFNSTYFEHNPYTHSLISILKCAQAIEVLFGDRDSIRRKCRALNVSDEVIESEIVRIIVTRHKLGSAHASGFVPTPLQADTLRHFALRATHTVRNILLLVSAASSTSHPYLFESFQRDSGKEKLLDDLQETLQQPLWSPEAEAKVRVCLFEDPRLGA